MSRFLKPQAEFLPTSAIRARYGPTGITGYDEVYGRRGAITDDTQMTLFTAEALLGGGDPLHQLRDAYLRWLQTQDEPLPSGDGLLAVLELHSLRAPGNTCLAALRSTRHGARGTPTDPINDSKGCGGVMRAAPAGLVATDTKQAFALGLRPRGDHPRPPFGIPPGRRSGRHGAPARRRVEPARGTRCRAG